MPRNEGSELRECRPCRALFRVRNPRSRVPCPRCGRLLTPRRRQIRQADPRKTSRLIWAATGGLGALALCVAAIASGGEEPAPLPVRDLKEEVADLLARADLKQATEHWSEAGQAIESAKSALQGFVKTHGEAAARDPVVAEVTERIREADRRFSNAFMHERDRLVAGLNGDLRDLRDKLFEHALEAAEEVVARIEMTSRALQDMDPNHRLVRISADETARAREEIARARGRDLEALARSEPELIKRFGKGLVRVMVPGSETVGFGTGFAVRPDLVLTNRHVVGDAEYVEVYIMVGGTNATQGPFRARVVARAELPLDFALVQLPRAMLEPLPYRLALPTTGAEVIALGFPGGKREADAELGRVTRTEHIEDIPLIYTDSGVGHGNSGGPLVEYATGEVVGVVTFAGEAAYNGLAIGLSVLPEIFPEWFPRAGDRAGTRPPAAVYR